MDGAQCQHELSRVRRKRRPAKPGEIAAAVSVVVVGAAVIAAIVLVDPRWHRIFASWRAGFAGVPGLVSTRPLSIRPDGLEAQQATAGSPEAIPSSQPVPVRPIRAEPTASVIRSPSRAALDTTQVMANLLVSQLGPDPAWRTAMANAETHAADSPEHAYWRSVAAVIRDVGLRPRP